MRSERTVQIGQEAMKLLFKEPIKEAVKETLTEEGINEGVKSERTDRLSQKGTTQKLSKSEMNEDKSGGIISNIVIPAATVLGIALALRQLNEGQLEPETVAEKIRGEETSEEDMSESTPSNSGRSQFAENDSEEVNV